MSNEPSNEMTAEVTLKARHVRILGAEGEELELSTFACPALGESVGPDVCLVCERCVELKRNLFNRPQEVVCRLENDGWPRETGGPLADPTDVPVLAIAGDEVVAVLRDTMGRDVLRRLVENGVDAAPVVNRAGRLLGVVATRDLMRECYELLEEPGEAQTLDESLDLLTAEGLMTAPALTLGTDATLAEAAALMAAENIRFVPIVTADDELVAGLHSLDIARWIAERSGMQRLSQRPRRRS